MWQGMETGHLLNETASPTPPPSAPSSACQADSYSQPMEASAFSAALMIAWLLSPAPSHPAVRLRKPPYQTAADIVVVVGGVRNREGKYVEGKVGIEEKESERAKPKGKVLASHS